MMIPIEILESDLFTAGFRSTVPKNEHSFLGGHDKTIEDAPLGYYRFHYWINSDSSKPHENFLFFGKYSGFICVSMMQDTNEYYRVLVRSIVGWKAVLIKQSELKMTSNTSTRTIVLKEAMRRFCEDVFPRDLSIQKSELSSPLNMVSIDINTKDDKILSEETVSRSSSLNSIKSSFTLSALRASFMGSQDSISRFGSMSSLSDFTFDSSEDIGFDSENNQNIIEDLTNKFFKSGYQVKDSSFSSNLLELEKALTPKSFNFDVINLSNNSSETFRKFQESLGNEINRKETINYINILTAKFKISEPQISTAVSSTDENSDLKILEKSKNLKSTKLDFIIAEFIETEKNYLEQLCLIKKIFISHLQNEDSGKFILKMRDFKNIFDGLVDFIPIHEKFLANLTCNQGLENFLLAISQLSNSKDLYSYQSYFTTYEKRIAALKSCLELNPKFLQFHENCVNNISDLNKKGLDQMFIAPIQRIPRYALLLKEASKYVLDSYFVESINALSSEIAKVAQFLNTSKHKSEQTEMLFMMQRKINNFPPDFLRADRMFLSKMACFMIDSGDGKASKIRLTIYLCNDLLIFAKKRFPVSGLITHDFIFAINICHAQLNASRGKKAEKLYLNAEIDMNQALFTHDISNLDSTLFCRKRLSTFSCITDKNVISSNFKFSPKNQKKLTSFIAEFTEIKNQFILSDSPAKLMFKQENDKDIFFHIFESKELVQWKNKSPVVIIYVEDNINLSDHIEFLSEYSAVAIVQGRLNAFRFLIRTKHLDFSESASPSFETEMDLNDMFTFNRNFHKAVLNAHLIMSIYPPHAKNILQQRRFVLESAIAASKPGGFSLVNNKSSGLRNFLSGLTGSTDKLNSDKLSRGSSLKNGSSPLSSPSKISHAARIDELKREIKIESSMSYLHL